MTALENLFTTVSQNPPFVNGTAVHSLKEWVSSVNVDSVKGYVLVLVLTGLILSLLVVAIVYRVKTHSRRERRWRKASFQERKCSACRSLSCDHPSFIGVGR